MSRGFRIWDIESECYLSVSTGSNDGVLGVTIDGTGVIYLEDGEANIQLAGVIIEQDTGLKDKNGKEIYENCELDGKYRVEYIAPKFVCKDIINGDIIELYDNKFTITKEHCEISQNSERGIN